jgi:hypothetical protein
MAPKKKLNPIKWIRDHIHPKIDGQGHDGDRQNTAPTKRKPDTVHVGKEGLADDAAQAQPAPTVGVIHRRLWDEAYDSIKKEDEDLVNAYEVAVSDFLKPGAQDDQDTTPKTTDVGNVPNTISNDPDKRREQMEDAVKLGLEKRQKYAKVVENIGTAAEYLLKGKDIITLAVSTVPQAAIPWAAVSLTLEVSSTPAPPQGLRSSTELTP